MKKNKILEALKNILCGIVLGIANVIPGVSGGTMAVVMNIYDDILDAISIKRLVKNLFFIITILIGLAIGILLFSKLIEWLFLHYPAQTNFFFAGLIIGSIPMICKKSVEVHSFRPVNLIAFVLALGLMVFLFFQKSGDTIIDASNMTIGKFLLFVLAGAIAAFAMIVPGISGSMIMVIMGMYTTVISAVSNLNFSVLIPVGIGILIGLIGGINLIKLLIKKAPQTTYLAILGLIIGSFLSLWPENFESLSPIGMLICFVALAVGFVISFLFSRSKKEEEAKAKRTAAQSENALPK